MFERLNTPEQIFSYKLGAALTMEKDTLGMLEALQKAAQREELKQLLREHAEETRQQIELIEQCFALLGEKVDDSPCPVTKALAAEATATIKKTDDSLVDAVILAGALETEHHEQAVYETLVIHARARGAERVAVLLETNLAVEQSAGARVKELATRIATTGVAVETGGTSLGAKAGVAAGVAAAVGAAAAVASKVAEHKGASEAREAAEESLRTTPATTSTTTSATTSATSEPGYVDVRDAVGTTGGGSAGGAAGAASAEEFNDDALQERIAETEQRASHGATGH
ncbi:ferritin-like domain-containing protein [Kineococcus sp. SYSU DK006]|uniref:ferritin-like domain-containing protein n=1 Tax=Kineococcus sp. SYSU DK006 TaxID=3383127 RepID=UPI003D7DC5F8